MPDYSRITELDEVTELLDTDYIMLDNPTLGVRKFKAINLGSQIIYNAEDLKVAEYPNYITVNLDEALEVNEWYIGSLRDSEDSPAIINYPVLFKRTSGTQIVPCTTSTGTSQLKFTDTTVSLSSYPGNYRDVWLRLSKVLDAQMYIIRKTPLDDFTVVSSDYDPGTWKKVTSPVSLSNLKYINLHLKVPGTSLDDDYVVGVPIQAYNGGDPNDYTPNIYRFSLSVYALIAIDGNDIYFGVGSGEYQFTDIEIVT